MTLDNTEREFIRALPKRLIMCPNLQKAKDKKLRAELFAELGDSDLVDRVMRVVRECRG